MVFNAVRIDYCTTHAGRQRADNGTQRPAFFPFIFFTPHATPAPTTLSKQLSETLVERPHVKDKQVNHVRINNIHPIKRESQATKGRQKQARRRRNGQIQGFLRPASPSQENILYSRNCDWIGHCIHCRQEFQVVRVK